jgi:ADP-ribose pyrophosphatase YjhB (NUDIX family)
MTVCYPLREFPSSGSFTTDKRAYFEIALGRKADTRGARELSMVGKWNGAGGKVRDQVDLSCEHCSQRETSQEFGIIPVLDHMKRAGTILFIDEGSRSIVHFYFAHLWTGRLLERSPEFEEIRWFDMRQLPLREMPDTDRRFCLPLVLHGALVRGQVLSMTVHRDSEMRVVKNSPIIFTKITAAA